jgi:hemoglobin
VAVGLDEARIAAVVHAFYARVRRDPVLGPIFEGKVEDWDEHLTRLVDFWSSVLLATGRYRGKPTLVHARIEAIDGTLFQRWLALFEATAAELCLPAQAALFIDRARRIADSLEQGIAFQRKLTAGR